MKKQTLGNRMKNFEACYDLRVVPRLPAIVRLDGRAFHAWTKKSRCERPFDEKLMLLMAETTKFLCENIDGCVFGYTQSDEISLLLRDDQSRDSMPWFDKRVQKIVSVSASMATAFFNAHNPFEKKTPAFFDARVLALPEEEIRPYFIWRQNDATKNSLSMLAQSLYHHTELIGKKRDDLQELCFRKGFNWNNLTTQKKRGSAVYKRSVTVSGKGGTARRMKFFIDENTPVFSAENCDLFDTIFEVCL